MILLFNKPYGVISQFTTHNDYESLGRYIPFKNIYPVGRLDNDSEGLLILTDNGHFQNKLSNPENNIYKTYWAQVENIPNDQGLGQLREGIRIKNYITKPAKVKLIEPPNIWSRSTPIRERKTIPTCWIELKISEGKNRQVRKMTAAISAPTLRLIRVGIGDYRLDKLMPGEYKVIES
jgi:23S rRNA pseudouridine2457 synthase|tara:strand:- start:1213 stop:1746 length:534 start_codon:yes stop_codon:yes gene_type:complete